MKIFFAYGRMNPPTNGHLRIVEKLLEEAHPNGVARVYLSLTQDTKRNPLTPEQKLDFSREFFPDIEIRLAKTLFDATVEMASEGFEEGVMYVGEDRLETFSKLLAAYAGTEVLGLKSVEVRAITREALDTSATAARAAAEIGDWNAFKAMSPNQDEDLTQKLYEAVRIGLGVMDGPRNVHIAEFPDCNTAADVSVLTE